MTRAAAGRRLNRVRALALAGGLLAAPLALHMQDALAAPCSSDTRVCITAPADTAQISGNAVHIVANVGMGSSEKLNWWKVEVAVNPPSGQAAQWNAVPDTASNKCANPAATGSSVNIDCVWDTTRALPNGGPANNNVYLVKVTAFDGGPFRATGEVVAQITAVATNPVATPTGLALVFNDGTQKLTVSWNANTEPDLTNYVLNETINTKTTGWSLTPAQAHCSAGSCNWSRQVTSGGTYKYDVVAVRNAPGTQSGRVSSQASGSKQATFADPNPTTTTSTTRPADPGSTGGSTGGSGSTGGTGATGTKAGTSSSRTGESASVSGFRVVQIASGNPGTISSSGSASGRIISGGGGGGGLVGEGDEPDTGFSSTLPYKNGQKADQPESISQAIANIPSRLITDEGARKKAMSLIAIGLVLFVFAMQVRFITRRAAQQA